MKQSPHSHRSHRLSGGVATGRVTPGWTGAVLLSVFVCITLGGCCGYTVGARSLYNTEIKTVFVPMIEVDSYRTGLGERLTEAVCKRITERTPYTLADPGKADSTLLIRVVADSQSVTALNKYNDTRQKNLSWSVTALWQDRRNIPLAKMEPLPLTSLGVSINAQTYLVAEMGQSDAVSQQDLIDKIADQIVGLMEEKW